MLQMVIEDAELSQQDLYTLQVNYSSAFNMIDQDRLLMVTTWGSPQMQWRW